MTIASPDITPRACLLRARFSHHFAAFADTAPSRLLQSHRSPSVRNALSLRTSASCAQHSQCYARPAQADAFTTSFVSMPSLLDNDRPPRCPHGPMGTVPVSVSETLGSLSLFRYTHGSRFDCEPVQRTVNTQ